jgi:hypothetical protein
MKYWFHDFQKKKICIDFLDELELFIGKKNRLLRKKKSPPLCRLPWIHGCPNENFVPPIFERSFQVRHFSFWITEGIGLTGNIFVFLTSATNSVGYFWLLFHFHVKNLPILMFLGLICKILCWAQKSILYGVWNATESHESPKTEFVSHEIFISHVTYPSIRNFNWIQKSIRYMGSEMQPQIMRAQLIKN